MYIPALDGGAGVTGVGVGAIDNVGEIVGEGNVGEVIGLVGTVGGVVGLTVGTVGDTVGE